MYAMYTAQQFCLCLAWSGCPSNDDDDDDDDCTTDARKKIKCEKRSERETSRYDRKLETREK